MVDFCFFATSAVVPIVTTQIVLINDQGGVGKGDRTDTAESLAFYVFNLTYAHTCAHACAHTYAHTHTLRKHRNPHQQQKQRFRS